MKRVLASFFAATALISGSPSQASTAGPLDVLFLFDSSNSVGAGAFGTLQGWANSIIDTYLGDPDTKISVLHLTDPTDGSANTFTTALSFADPGGAGATAAKAAITGLAFEGRGPNLEPGLLGLLNEFDTNGRSDATNPELKRAAILLGDGDDGPGEASLCNFRNLIGQEDIAFFVATAGETLSAEVSCVLDDPVDNFVDITSFSPLSTTFVEALTPETIPAVPLPAGLPLLGAGLAGFALLRRRKPAN